MASFSFSQTNLKTQTFIYTCKIKNFKAAHPGNGEYIEFEGFVDEHKVWYVNVFPDGCDEDTKEYVGVRLSFVKEELNIDDFPYLLSIYLIDVNKVEHEVYSDTFPEDNVSIEKFVERKHLFNEKKDLLPNGNLIMRYKLYFSYETTVDPELPQINFCSSNLKPHCFEKIFDEEKFSDVRITVGDKVFWAYKGILASKSSVFAAMFEHDMRENCENVVKIADIDHEVVQEMLRFIYIDRVNNIEKLARGLLVAADKYALQDLKILCEKTLIDELNTETVISLIALAERHGASFLKETALDYFKCHAQKIVKNEKCKAQLHELVPVLPELLTSLLF